VRLGCDGMLDAPPASTQVCFTRRALAMPPIYRPQRSSDEGRFSEGGGRGKIIAPSSSSSSSSSHEDSNSEGVSPPSCHCGSLGNTFEPFFLFSRALPFIFGAVGLPPHHILRQGDPHKLLRTHPRPYNMSVAGTKKVEIDTIKRK
jgi:hypothetical protein